MTIVHLVIPDESRLPEFLGGTTYLCLENINKSFTTEDFPLVITIYRVLFSNSQNAPATFVSADFTPAVSIVGLGETFREFTDSGLLAHCRQSSAVGRHFCGR
jgi:hypothetical protein